MIIFFSRKSDKTEISSKSYNIFFLRKIKKILHQLQPNFLIFFRATVYWSRPSNWVDREQQRCIVFEQCSFFYTWATRNTLSEYKMNLQKWYVLLLSLLESNNPPLNSIFFLAAELMLSSKYFEDSAQLLRPI